MKQAKSLSSYIGMLALLLALIAFTLGPAPFTPARLLAPLALLLAIAAGRLGSRRLASVAAYWAVAAWLTDPVSAMWRVRVDGLILIFAVLGLLLGALLYVTYLGAVRLEKHGDVGDMPCSTAVGTRVEK